jgi:hypothetical protein
VGHFVFFLVHLYVTVITLPHSDNLIQFIGAFGGRRHRTRGCVNSALWLRLLRAWL